MSDRPSISYRTVDVGPDFLPAPATKLVITQYIVTRQDPPCWAWIIVGAFIDSDDNILWSIRLFAAYIDTQLDSDDDESGAEVNTSYASSDSDSESGLFASSVI